MAKWPPGPSSDPIRFLIKVYPSRRESRTVAHPYGLRKRLTGSRSNQPFDTDYRPNVFPIGLTGVKRLFSCSRLHCGVKLSHRTSRYYRTIISSDNTLPITSLKYTGCSSGTARLNSIIRFIAIEIDISRGNSGTLMKGVNPLTIKVIA